MSQAALRRGFPHRRVGLARKSHRQAFRSRWAVSPASNFVSLHVIEFAANGDIKRENVWFDMAAVLQQLPQD